MTDLRQTVDNLRDLFSKLALDFFDCHRRIFDDVVYQSTRDGDCVELEIGENLRDFHAMRHEVFAGEALLSLVRRLAETIGAQKQLLVQAIRERLTTVVPTGNDCPGFDRRHNSPASAKLRYRPLPIIM